MLRNNGDEIRASRAAKEDEAFREIGSTECAEILREPFDRVVGVVRRGGKFVHWGKAVRDVDADGVVKVGERAGCRAVERVVAVDEPGKMSISECETDARIYPPPWINTISGFGASEAAFGRKIRIGEDCPSRRGILMTSP